ncbi:hypothetical protein RUM43_008661, partial [Polyplax serrata]
MINSKNEIDTRVIPQGTSFLTSRRARRKAAVSPRKSPEPPEPETFPKFPKS